MGEVAAFEELIGSHGGLGGFQTQPFILHPVDWELDEPVPLGAPAIYRNIRRWLESIGIELGKPAEAAAASAAAAERVAATRCPSTMDQAASPPPSPKAPGRVAVGRAWNASSTTRHRPSGDPPDHRRRVIVLVGGP